MGCAGTPSSRPASHRRRGGVGDLPNCCVDSETSTSTARIVAAAAAAVGRGNIAGQQLVVTALDALAFPPLTFIAAAAAFGLLSVRRYSKKIGPARA